MGKILPKPVDIAPSDKFISYVEASPGGMKVLFTWCSNPSCRYIHMRIEAFDDIMHIKYDPNIEGMDASKDLGRFDERVVNRIFRECFDLARDCLVERACKERRWHSEH